MWKFYKRPQRFGDWICLHPQVDQDRPIQLGPSERTSLNRAQLSRSILTHPPQDGDRSSLRNLVVFCKTSTYLTMDRVQRIQIALYNIYHRQNLFKSNCECCVAGLGLQGVELCVDPCMSKILHSEARDMKQQEDEDNCITRSRFIFFCFSLNIITDIKIKVDDMGKGL
jgi:hypothetical protein